MSRDSSEGTISKSLQIARRCLKEVDVPFPGARGGASDGNINSCHKLLKKSFRCIAIEIKDGIE